MKSAQAHETLKRLRALAQAQRPLLDAIRSALPAPLHAQVTGAALEDGTLVVLASQAAAGTRLRYAEREILQAVHRNWPHLKLRRMTVRIEPPTRPRRWSRKASPPDDAALRQLEATAETLTHDNLRQRLLRLSQKLKRIR